MADGIQFDEEGKYPNIQSGMGSSSGSQGTGQSYASQFAGSPYANQNQPKSNAGMVGMLIKYKLTNSPHIAQYILIGVIIFNIIASVVIYLVLS